MNRGLPSRDQCLGAGAIDLAHKYNSSENAFDGSSMGAVGPAWAVDGVAAASLGGGVSAASTAQLVQAMASMGGGAALGTATSSTAGAELSQPTLLTTPHPA
jgi:hypothetical protein